MFCDFPKYKHLKQTIFRGPGGTGSASSDSDTTEFQEFLVQSQAARDAAQAAQAAAEAAEAAAEAAAGNVDAGVAASAASATAAAGSASSAATSATNASSSASSASTSATNAASSASSASTSASSASTSATNAGNSATAAASSATAASASASAAASSASTATTQASNAAGSASSASTSASTATTQASNAASSASAASTSAIAASTSATNAASSATAAASSATNAAASASEAVTTLASTVKLTGDQTIAGTKTLSSNPVLSAGTANGVVYANGSKVLTSGSTLTFDGTNLGVNISGPTFPLTRNGITLKASGSDGAEFVILSNTDSGYTGFAITRTGADSYLSNRTNGALVFSTNNSEQMRLTTTGLGIGTSSITDKLTLGSGRIKINTGGLALYMGNDGADNALQLVSGASIKFQSGSGYATNMLLDSSGNLGLGVTPAYKVDVSGDVNVTGSYRVNGVATTGLTGGQTGSAPLYGARAWVNFNGTGTVAIRASGNVSSITDNGVGDYTVNFSNAMPDANYCAVANGDRSANPASDMNNTQLLHTYATSSVRLKTGYPQSLNTLDDSLVTTVAVFR